MLALWESVQQHLPVVAVAEVAAPESTRPVMAAPEPAAPESKEERHTA